MLVGLAVILWGIQYKLSLYHSVAAQRVIPAAKLLSQKERMATSVAETVALAPPSRHTAGPTSTVARFGALPGSGWRLSSDADKAASLPSDQGEAVGASAFRQSSPRAPPIAA